MKSILFVDDETSVLEGLRRMLRPLRREWDVAFAASGKEALDLLAQRPFDVVVSDMRMPVMDGATFLAEVSAHYPQVVRIVLSGHAATDMTIRSAATAHQYLSKPCDADTLKSTIDRAFALRNVLTNEALRSLLSQLNSLPSIPALYTELMEELKYPDASVKRIGDIVARDVAMTAKILQLVNSAFFGLPRHVSSPQQAAALLGSDTIKSLVLSIDVFSQFTSTEIDGLDAQSVSRHSMQTAELAKRIVSAERANKEVTDATVIASLLHDAGKLVLAQSLPAQYRAVLERVRSTGMPSWEAERETFGASHAEVGAYLLGLWGLPDAVIEAVAFHHTPGKCPSKSFCPLTAVHVADAFARERENACPDGRAEALDLDYLDEAGLSKRVSAWRAACQEAGAGSAKP